MHRFINIIGAESLNSIKRLCPWGATKDEKMKEHYKTKAQLLSELEETHHLVREVEECQIQFHKAQMRYENLLGSAPDAVIFVNHHGRIALANTQFERMFGYHKDEVVGLGLDLLIPDRFRVKHHQDMEDFFLNPGVHPMGSDYEIYALKKNGKEFPIDVTLSPLQTDEGLLVTAAIRDVTKRKQAEEEVKLNFFIQKVVNNMLRISLEALSLEEQCQRILELFLSIPHFSLNSRGAIYLVEENSEILVMKAQQGFPESDILPCKQITFGQCLCGQAADAKNIVFTDLMHPGETKHCEGSLPHGHYCVPILLRDKTLGLINIWVKEGHKRIVGEDVFLSAVAQTMAGIIDRYQTDQKMKGLQVQLLKAEKMAALGRLTANIAHEIRNPLTVIGGFARRLERGFPEETKEKKALDLILTEVHRLEGILKNVLSLSETAPPVLAKGLIHETIDTALKTKEEQLGKQGIAVQKIYKKIPQVSVDMIQVQEAVENLILNAMDAMPQGGVLTASTGKVFIRDHSYVYLKIQDSGKGIPEELRPLIFEPFYTTKVAEKRVGMGLSITKKIVEDHGGFIREEKISGNGDAFVLYFPLPADESENRSIDHIHS